MRKRLAIVPIFLSLAVRLYAAPMVAGAEQPFTDMFSVFRDFWFSYLLGGIVMIVFMIRLVRHMREKDPFQNYKGEVVAFVILILILLIGPELVKTSLSFFVNTGDDPFK